MVAGDTLELQTEMCSAKEIRGEGQQRPPSLSLSGSARLLASKTHTQAHTDSPSSTTVSIVDDDRERKRGCKELVYKTAIDVCLCVLWREEGGAPPTHPRTHTLIKQSRVHSEQIHLPALRLRLERLFLQFLLFQPLRSHGLCVCVREGGLTPG